MIKVDVTFIKFIVIFLIFIVLLLIIYLEVEKQNVLQSHIDRLDTHTSHSASELQRKAPTCRKCGEAMKGHKRKECETQGQID
jgi:predicted Holliday junction resolvase-like endonuclease